MIYGLRYGRLDSFLYTELRWCREETSNNRVKSGYTHRGIAPIDKVPDAGSLAVSSLSPRSYSSTQAYRHLGTTQCAGA
jgi:hypothetical protein